MQELPEEWTELLPGVEYIHHGYQGNTPEARVCIDSGDEGAPSEAVIAEELTRRHGGEWRLPYGGWSDAEEGQAVAVFQAETDT